MTSAGSNAGTGQAREPADAGSGVPGPGQAGQDAAAEQAGQADRAEQPEAEQAEADRAEADRAEQPAATRPAAPVLSEQSREDTDIAWGDYRGRDDEDRDRLYRDRPPHWADY